jgi:hypothetical protein
VRPLNTTERANHASQEGLDHSSFSVAMSTVCERPWLIEEKMRMRMTPKTMTAVPLISVEVTAEVRSGTRYDSRVPTSQ